MRDLTARLREIVRQPIGTHSGSEPEHPRELTYAPDVSAPAVDLDRTAAMLGGSRHDAPGSSCIVIDRAWEPGQWHGRKHVEAYAIRADAPLALLDCRLAAHADWASRVVFFDIETTGLSGGAGTLALLVGCGWFDNGGFVVRQFFLSGPAGERAMLDALAQILGEASLLVTYNGRTFDVPVMDTRWAFHRRDSPTEELPHFDMLAVARRLWGRRAPRGGRTRESAWQADERRATCALSALERSVLKFHRLSDVPGLEIPSRYFQFLRTGDPGPIEGVLEHNRHDIISLAAITSHALQLAADGPEACECATELLGLGSLYERAGDLARAEQAYGMAAACDDPEVAVQALARLAVMLRRDDRFDDAAAAWRGVLTLSDGRPDFASWAGRAAEALAIHHEHRARELSVARQYAETLRTTATGRSAAAVDHRIGRLEKKLKRTEPARGGLTRSPRSSSLW